MDANAWLDDLAGSLPEHAVVVVGLAEFVRDDERCRWLEVGCSLGSGRGDEHSDIDAGIGHAVASPAELDRLATDVLGSLGPLADAQAHRMEGYGPDMLRVAAELANGVQLDLAMFPATNRSGLFDGIVSIVDKDGRHTGRAVSQLFAPTAEAVREWTMLGWWAVSDVAKYIQRESWFEAVTRIDEARQHALRLDAAARSVPYPAFGLTSLLDAPPFELPSGTGETYGRPARPDEVVAAARAVADLLADASRRAAAALGVDLSTAWATTCRARLERAIDRA